MGFGSPWHWMVIGVIALLLFGNRLPDVARSLGRAFNEFKRGLKDVGDEFGKDDKGRDDPPRDRLDAPSARSDEAAKREREAAASSRDDTGH